VADGEDTNPDEPEEPFDEEVPPRPPLPPEDRIWRHPSEIAGARPSAPPRRRRHRLLAGSAVSLAAVALAAWIAIAVDNGTSPFVAKPHHPTTTTSTVAMVKPTAAVDSAVVAAANRLRAALATVRVESLNGTASGTGVVVGANGLVVTSFYLVQDAAQITVELANGRTLPAKIEASDPDLGVSLLWIPASRLDPISPTTNSQVSAGDFVASVSAPLGNGSPSLAVGAVTAAGVPLVMGGGDLIEAIESELPPSPTEAGSLLLDARGELVGMCVASSGYKAVAAPWQLVWRDRIALAEGKIEHGWLGVLAAPAPEAPAQLLAGGVVVGSVVPGSPAARAGIEPGDLIVSVGSLPTPSMAALQQAVRAHDPGDKVKIELIRHGRVIWVSAVLGHQPQSSS